MLTPQELQARFPIGRILELQTSTREKILFLCNAIKAVPLVSDHLNKVFEERADTVTQPELHKEIRVLYAEKPLETAISMSMAGGWTCMNALEHAQMSIACMRRLIWALVYADIVIDYKIDQETYQILRLSMVDDPPAAGVLVIGYLFTEEQLGKARGLGQRPPIAPSDDWKIPDTTEGLLDNMDDPPHGNH